MPWVDVAWKLKQRCFEGTPTVEGLARRRTFRVLIRTRGYVLHDMKFFLNRKAFFDIATLEFLGNPGLKNQIFQTLFIEFWYARSGIEDDRRLQMVVLYRKTSQKNSKIDKTLEDQDYVNGMLNTSYFIPRESLKIGFWFFMFGSDSISAY